MSKPSEANRPGRRPPSGGRTRSRGSSSRTAKGSSRARTASTTQSRAPESVSGHVSERFVDAKAAEKAPRRIASETSATSAAGAKPSASAPTPSSASGFQRWWALQKPHVQRFAPGILINHAITLAVILCIAIIVGVGPGFGYVPSVIGSLWMQVNLAPLNIAGAQLGFAPLLPAMAVVWWHARRTTNALGNSVSVRGLRVYAALNIGIPVLLTLVAWVMLWDASHVYDLAAPNLLVAVVSTIMVNAASVVIGMRARVWRALLLRKGFATWPLESFSLSNRFLLWMTAAGAVVAVVYALLNFRALAETYEITDGIGGAIAMTMLALLYLPNIAMGAAGVLMGGEFHIGDGSFSYFAASNVNVPPFPLSAAIPNGPVPYAAVGFVIPAAVALWVVYSYVRKRDFVEAPLYIGISSAFVAAFVGFCVAWLAGGDLGVYGHTGTLEWLFALLAAAWIAVPAVVVMLWARYAGRAVIEDVDDVDEPDAELETPAASAAAEAEDTEGTVNTEDAEDAEDTEDTEEDSDEKDEDSDSGLGDGDTAAERD